MPQDKEQATEDELDVPGDLEQALLVSGSGQLCSRGGSKSTLCWGENSMLL